MSKFFHYTTILIFISCNAIGQVKIATRTERLFFIGIDNEIIIQSTKIPLSNLSVDVENGSVSGKNGNFSAHFSKPLKEVTIKVFFNKKLVADKKMEVARVSEPVVYAVGDTIVKGGLISKRHLLTFNSLIVTTNVPFLSMSVIHFEFRRISDGVVVDSLKNNSAYFSKRLKQVLQKVKEGDTIFFEETYCIGPDENGVNRQTIKLNVVDK